MRSIETYKDFEKGEPFPLKIKKALRKQVLFGLSFKYGINNSNNWIQFPYYHHVFDDEKCGFERQLKYLKNYGEFISMDEACDMIEGKLNINGRFFSVSFDDGFYNCYTNMMEIITQLDIPVMIYLPTNYIGLTPENPDDFKKIQSFYPEYPRVMSFLNWEQCRSMLPYGVSFGSHTCSHANLYKLNRTQIKFELEISKLKIEDELGVECLHFACPFGRPYIEFDPQIAIPIAKDTGYKSFATTVRGKMRSSDDPFMINRQHLLSNWENYQLKYFFGR